MTALSNKEDNEHLAALEQEKARLLNAVHHLERSNAELTDALTTSGPDKEFELAVKENKRVEADFQASIYKLTVEIAGITGNVEQVTPRGVAAEADGQWL
jgi:hypothetical protein